MNSPLPNHLHRSSNAYGHYSNRLRLAGVLWLRSVSDNGERKRQKDSGERRAKSASKRQKTVPAGKAGWTGLCGPYEIRSKGAYEQFTGGLRQPFKISLANTRGIVKMAVNNFYAACVKNATLALQSPTRAQTFEKRQLLWCGRVLKILVSVVRFRPEPPLLIGLPARAHNR